MKKYFKFLLLLPMPLLCFAQQEEVLLKKIDMVEARNGAYSSQLIEIVGSLGDYYQQAGQYSKAVNEFYRVIGLLHRTEGLYTINQVPVLEKAADGFLALGQPLDAELLYQKAAWVYYRNGINDNIEYIKLKSRFWEKYIKNQKIQ